MTVLIFAIVVAFGLVMVTIAVLPIIPQAQSGDKGHKAHTCHNAEHPPPCNKHIPTE